MNTPSLFDVDGAPASQEGGDRQLLLGLAASRFTSQCRTCGRPMTMVQLLGSRKWMPFDADPVAIKTSHDPETGKLVEHLDPADSHFRTCPQASIHRRQR